MNDIERYKSKVLYRSIVGRETAKELWKGVLDTICGEDSFGNRPCDNGSTCDRCSQRVYEDVYIDKLKTQAKEQQGVSTNLQGYLSTKLDSKDSMYAIYSINNDILSGIGISSVLIILQKNYLKVRQYIKWQSVKQLSQTKEKSLKVLTMLITVSMTCRFLTVLLYLSM